MPFGINNSGEVVGQSYTASASPIAHSFLYSGGTLHDLGTFGGNDSGATAINNLGQVVGVADTTGTLAAHAFLYSGGPLMDLGTLGGTTSSANGINDSGQIVGQAFTGPTIFHAFLYSGGTMSDLGTLGGNNSEAFGINSSGQVVGISDTATAGHAFLYDGGTMHDLGTLGGTISSALAINDSGEIVGYADTGTAPKHAFYYDGTMHDLGTGGGSASVAAAINSSGQIVGFFYTSATVTRAFLYSGGVMTDLNTLLEPGSLATGVFLAAASAINDSGQIAAVDSNEKAYLLTPSSSGKTSQTIEFGALANLPLGSAPFTLSATASSGLPVSFAAESEIVGRLAPRSACRVSGKTVTMVAVGQCTIQANQSGNASYSSAPPVSQSFQVTQGSQTIDFSTLSNHSMGASPFRISATASSGLGVTFASMTKGVCTVSRSLRGGVQTAGYVTLIAAGACTIQASQAGNANYQAATPVSQSFQVTP